MAIPNKQIGWSNESNLLWEIVRQMDRLTKVVSASATTAPYKVFTALLSQTGGDNQLDIYSGAVTKGVTYRVVGSSPSADFSNIGGPIGENDDFLFVATTNEIPNNYGGGGLLYNTGAPVVKILENTLGNITFAYNGIGLYDINSNELFTENKTYTVLQVWGDDQVTSRTAITTWENSSLLTLRSLSLSGDPVDAIGNDNVIAFFLTSIEIRVYN